MKWALTDTTTPSQNEFRYNSNRDVLYTPQSSLTRASPTYAI